MATVAMHRPALVGRYPAISVAVACALHYVWCVGLILDPGAVNATGVHMVMVVAPDTVIAAFMFFGVAFLATLGITARDTAARVVLILPQQALLWFSVVGAVHAMYLGTFADGTARTPWFLIVDQMPVVLIALGHTAGLFLIARTGECDDGG